MQRCLYLAAKGIGHVAPNPIVGCVIVYEDRIIGEGYHQQYGGPHAEVNAINSVVDESLLRHSTLYVNLEPCSHYGKTPPCANLIIAKKIPRVVIGSYDPNPLVAGKGIQLLRENGVEVITEVLKDESDFLNRRFFTFHTKKRPYIILKWAQSADGFIAPDGNKPYWLTNDVSKKLVHQWRSEEPGIMVGYNTVMIDDPELTVRLVKGKNPVRITLDRDMTLMPRERKILDMKTQTYVFNAKDTLATSYIAWFKIDFDGDVIAQVLTKLHESNIQSVIVEGGAKLLNSFILSNRWDEARIFYTPSQLGNGLKAPILTGKLLEERYLEDDLLRIFLPQ
jgi:diaminohydroxyphosphoribosylaminopyrimidine deaminase / 5-amino-6-(5-phosphoribosylamino)uracil reductase